MSKPRSEAELRLARYKARKRRKMQQAFKECDVFIPTQKTIIEEAPKKPLNWEPATRVDVANRRKLRQLERREATEHLQSIVTDLVSLMMETPEDIETYEVPLRANDNTPPEPRFTMYSPLDSEVKERLKREGAKWQPRKEIKNEPEQLCFPFYRR